MTRSNSQAGGKKKPPVMMSMTKATITAHLSQQLGRKRHWKRGRPWNSIGDFPRSTLSAADLLRLASSAPDIDDVVQRFIDERAKRVQRSRVSICAGQPR
jgi:hypothetical protein